MKFSPAMLNAARLVRGGKLAEATEAIQRALRGDMAPHAADIEGTGYRVVDVETSKCAQGQFVTRSYTNAAGTRLYKIYIPAANDGHAVPLVVMLHGCKQGPDDFAAATRMNALAEEHGFFVVYPRQAAKANVSKCWNWFQSKHQQRDRGEPSLIAGITREVVAHYGLDTRRVYIAGLSAGGAMAAVMGTTYSDVYAAVGIHSGLAHAAARDVPSAFAAMRGEGSNRTRPRHRGLGAARHVPTIVFHGESDTTVHPSNGDDVIAQAAPASSTPDDREHEFAQLERTVEYGETGGRTYTRTTYRDPGGKPVMEQWLVHGAAHAWCGGSTAGSYSDPTGPDASREMLRFFQQHQNS